MCTTLPDFMAVDLFPRLLRTALTLTTRFEMCSRRRRAALGMNSTGTEAPGAGCVLRGGVLSLPAPALEVWGGWSRQFCQTDLWLSLDTHTRVEICARGVDELLLLSKNRCIH